jgi:glyoxylase-like metal-dependent hydrolase (beta-lactamase superfamily II)
MHDELTTADIFERSEQLTDRVVRMPLPLPLPDLRAINSYAILGTDGVTLVDPGWADERSEFALLAALQQLDCQPADVRRILVTHAHWDHYSRAIAWQRKYGATVFLGREERHSVAAFREADGAYPDQVQLLVRAGAPDLAETIANLPLEAFERDVPFGPPDVWVGDGDEIDCGGVSIVARATPGHTRGHVVFECPRGGMLFSGDHVLPRITPSIALERAPESLPLRSYLNSLQLLMKRPDLRLLPAHGLVTDSVRARVEELLIHHQERLDLVFSLVAEGSETAYDVARQMLWTRHERTVDELGSVHGMTAILEVAAHLQFLVFVGRLTAEVFDGADRYVAARGRRQG